MKEGGRKIRLREKLEDATLLALRMERDHSQEVRAGSRSWRRQKTDSPPDPPERSAALLTDTLI